MSSDLEMPATSQRAAQETAPINILIVDDDPKNLTVLETVLADPSYQLVRAGSGDEALLALIDHEFALIILDIQMPGMNGFEVAQLIKKRKKTAHVPIIFLTAYYNEDVHLLEGYDTGAVDYLYKPVNPAVLRSKVAVFAELYRKSREAAARNLALLNEIDARRRIEEQLRELNQTLEVRVAERTQELQEHAARLQRTNEVLEQFAYAAAHDLQEPLRNVAIYAQLLRERYGANLDHEAGAFLQVIMEGAQRMGDLVSGLLAYTQVNYTEDLATVADAEEVLKRVLRNLSHSLEQSRAAVTHDVLPSVPIKPIHLEQVMQNLLANALKFTRKGVPVEVRISALREENHWRISVSDNGIGIEPAYREQVFRVFKRLHGAGGEYPGTGIGLAICKRIVEQYDGRIWIESELGQGATFHFTVPAVRPKQ